MSQIQSDPVTFKTSLRRLKAAQKSPRGAPLYSVLVNRPMGRVFAACAHQMGLTPNQVTMISALFTYAGIVALAVMTPGLPAAVVVTVALVLGYALDASDGQLARLRGGGSLTGEWLDHVIDSGKIASLHLAVLITASQHFPVGSWWLFIPIAFAVAYVVHFFGFLLTDLLIRVHDARSGSPTLASPPSRLVSILKLPTDYGFFCLSFLLLAAPALFMVSYTLFAAAMVGYTILVLPKWYGRLSRLD